MEGEEEGREREEKRGKKEGEREREGSKEGRLMKVSRRSECLKEVSSVMMEEVRERGPRWIMMREKGHLEAT